MHYNDLFFRKIIHFEICVAEFFGCCKAPDNLDGQGYQKARLWKRRCNQVSIFQRTAVSVRSLVNGDRN